MHPLPHLYTVHAAAACDGDVAVNSADLPALQTAAPPEFDGPGGRWSPETLLCAAVADCFVLSFRAVARASGLNWQSLQCTVEGTLDRVEGRNCFTQMRVQATLSVPQGTPHDRAVKLLEKAEQVCLVSNSLLAQRHLETTIIAVDVAH